MTEPGYRVYVIVRGIFPFLLANFVSELFNNCSLVPFHAFWMHLVKIEVNLCQNVLFFVDGVWQIHQDSQAGCDDSIKQIL